VRSVAEKVKGFAVQAKNWTPFLKHVLFALLQAAAVIAFFF